MEEQYLNVEAVNASIYNTPTIAEVKKDNFVTFELGNHTGEEHHNTFFTHINDCYNTSTTNKACIDSLSDQVYGKGLAIEGKDGEPVSEGNGNSRIAKLNKILNAKDLKKLVKDRILFGQSAVQVIYEGVGSRKKVKKIKHFPIQTLAMGKIREGDKKINEANPSMPAVREVYYHPDWAKWEPRDKLTKLPTFGYGSMDAQMEIYICKPYMPGYWYFNLPGYSAALDYCRLEADISEYQIRDIETGFSGTTLINIQRNIADQDKRDYLAGDLMNKVSGINGNKTIITFNRSENEKMTMERFPLSDAPGHYEYLAQECSRKILTSHRITNPKLLAIPTPGEQGLGNNKDEILIAAEMLKNLVIDPYQMEILDALDEILENNNFNESLMFVNLDIVSEDFLTRSLERQQALWGAEAEAKDVGPGQDDTNNTLDQHQDDKIDKNNG